MKKFAVIACMVAAGLFVGAIFHQEVLFRPQKTFNGVLSQEISRDVPGWVAREQELDRTPEGRRQTERILNFSQAFTREYRKGDAYIHLYVAYWEPKTMPIRQVQSHTPDICWVRTGRFKPLTDLFRSEVSLKAGETPLKPAEYRAYNPDRGGETQYVMFWHVVGDTVYSTRSIGTWDRLDPVKSLLRFGLNQKTEQFFIRVSSNKDIFTLWDDKGLQAIMKDLAKLALQKAGDA